VIQKNGLINGLIDFSCQIDNLTAKVDHIPGNVASEVPYPYKPETLEEGYLE
jgi:hypothetical protein